MKKRAFTLAEVLITLGIIGIVAAMTLPSVIKNYQATVLESQFKKQYSSLSQALRKMYDEAGIDLIPDNFSDYTFSENLKAYYHIIKDCGMVNINTTGCITLDPTEDNVWNISTYKNFIGGSINFGYIDDGVLILNDGTTLLFEQGTQSHAAGYFLIGIDVNGFKNRPNRFGHDVFIFRIGPSGALMRTKDSIVGEICDYQSTSSMNGYGCAIRALTEKDYFKNLPK